MILNYVNMCEIKGHSTRKKSEYNHVHLICC